ncbi:metal-dependent hydrolase [Marssonina coronariae]|uniref:Metal-dependent hydrolase n=1 Tax=Diplocarpon coronariae TaxID=2795749 RepID=A0A218Z2X6_9HELO|nr:metal-dependent hydrolase [Marssonina coronariae]
MRSPSEDWDCVHGTLLQSGLCGRSSNGKHLNRIPRRQHTVRATGGRQAAVARALGASADVETPGLLLPAGSGERARRPETVVESVCRRPGHAGGHVAVWHEPCARTGSRASSPVRSAVRARDTRTWSRRDPISRSRRASYARSPTAASPR